MKINYRVISEYLSVDIDKLRPKSSYKNLIEKRSHPIDNLIKEHGSIPEQFLKLRKCPNCDCNDLKKELLKDHLWIVKCLNCELVFTNPIFDEEHYTKIYKSSDYQNVVKELGEESHNYRVKRFGMERVEAIKRFVRSTNKIKVLDVGCSTGFFVEAAKNNNWEAKGIDLNPSAIKFGRKRGLDLEQKELKDLPTNFKYDVITLFDVLEHLVDPSNIIENIKKYLSNEGIISLYVPNYDSASRYLMNKDAHFIWPSHHLTYFTIKTISNFLENREFEILEVKTEGLDIFDYIWWEENIKKHDVSSISKIANNLQFFVNAGGYGKNLRVIAKYVG